MTEHELESIRNVIAGNNPPRKSFDDYLAYGVKAVAIVTFLYFGAHFLAYLVGA